MDEASKMHPRPKQLWLEALRSGKYDQTFSRLRRMEADEDPEGFCCLGVLCDIFRKETGCGEWTDEGAFVLGGEKEVGAPPWEVAQWAGFIYRQPFVEVDWEEDSVEIAEENDRFTSFAEIADIIEEQL